MLFVRHGQTPTTGTTLPGRAKGLHLAEKGEQQAAAVAERIAPFGDRVAAVYASPLERTRETAAPIAKALKKRVRASRGLLECDFGAWTGRRHNELITELGAAYHEFWKSPARNRPPGGESFVDQIDRARAGLALLPAGDAVLVVHSGTIRAVLAIALDLAPDSALRFVIDPLSLTRIDRLADGWRVVAVNQRSKV